MNEPLDFLQTHLSDFQARYGEAIPDNTYPTNEFIENIIKRKTVRRFTDQKIDPKLLEKLFAAAQSSPTSSMLQTWCAIVIDSKERRKEIFIDDPENSIHMGIKPREILINGKLVNEGPADKGNYYAVMECSTFIVWCVDYNLIEEILTNSKTNEHKFYPTDTMKNAQDGVRQATYEIRAICDAMISAQTFCLAAESMGLGTMYCGSVKTMDLQNHLNFPKRIMPIVGICVGYPQANLDPMGGFGWSIEGKQVYIKPRLPQSLVIHHDKFYPRDITKIKKYNLILTKFYMFYKIGTIGRDWIYRVIIRNQTHERNRFYKKLLSKYGFDFK